MRRLLFAVTCLLACLGLSEAATYYVTPDGNNLNPCTLEAPCLTFNKPLPLMQPGDTLYIRGGEYLTSSSTNRFKSLVKSGTSWEAPITISAYPLPEGGYETVVIKPGVTAYTSIDLEGDQFKYIIFRGLILDGDYRVDRLIQLSQTGSMLQNNGTECGTASEATAPGPIIFEDMEVRKAAQMNINHGFWVHDIHYINMNVHSALTSHGGYLRGPRLLVKGGRWHHNPDGIGIQYYMNLAGIYPEYVALGCPLFEDGVFEDVEFDHNGSNGLWIGQGSKNAVARNVVSIKNGANGIHVGVKDATVLNSTLWGNVGKGLRIHSHDVTAMNNIVDRLEVASGLTNVVLDHNYVSTVDPGFVDAANDNFRLRNTATVIDAGLVLAEVPEDADGVARPQGLSHDIGAYEYDPPEVVKLVLPSAVTASTPNPGASYPLAELFNGVVNSSDDGFGKAGVSQLFVEFDFGQAHHFTQARLFGDTSGDWVSLSYVVFVRDNPADPWAFAATSPANTATWFDMPLDHDARYVRVEIYGPAAGTHARELELYGHPAVVYP
jgi:Right handed beta helix region